MWHLQFLFYWCAHLEEYILLKTLPELNQWFLSYEQSKDSQNNRKTKEIHSFFWLYLTINVPDFRLIPLDVWSSQDIQFIIILFNFFLFFHTSSSRICFWESDIISKSVHYQWVIDTSIDNVNAIQDCFFQDTSYCSPRKFTSISFVTLNLGNLHQLLLLPAHRAISNIVLKDLPLHIFFFNIYNYHKQTYTSADVLFLKDTDLCRKRCTLKMLH